MTRPDWKRSCAALQGSGTVQIQHWPSQPSSWRLTTSCSGTFYRMIKDLLYRDNQYSLSNCDNHNLPLPLRTSIMPRWSELYNSLTVYKHDLQPDQLKWYSALWSDSCEEKQRTTKKRRISNLEGDFLELGMKMVEPTTLATSDQGKIDVPYWRWRSVVFSRHGNKSSQIDFKTGNDVKSWWLCYSIKSDLFDKLKHATWREFTGIVV